MVGYSREELKGSGLDAVTHPDDLEKSIEVAQSLLAGKNEPIILQKRYVRKDGHVVWAEIRPALLRDQAGRPLYFMTEVLDITERQETERKREELERSLELSRHRLALLTDMTRHDIDNQLTTAYGYLELARCATPEGEAREDLERLRMALEKIRRMTEFTKAYKELGLHAPAWQNVGRLCRDAAGDIKKGTIEVVVECGDVEVLADQLFERVIHNLIDNSIRHGKKVTRIRIACELSGDMLVMVYEDDGVGIPESEKQLLFAKGHGKNGGMGLFLAREVLATTSISITENGTPGRGARFVMTIPAEAWRRPAADVPTVSETV